MYALTGLPLELLVLVQVPRSIILVQIAHNVVIDENCLWYPAGIAGSAALGRA